jgi:hypothetical protein
MIEETLPNPDERDRKRRARPAAFEQDAEDRRDCRPIFDAAIILGPGDPTVVKKSRDC